MSGLQDAEAARCQVDKLTRTCWSVDAGSVGLRHPGCLSPAQSDIPLTQAGRGWGELGLIVLHYVWTFGTAFACLAPLQAIAYLLLAQACGHPGLPSALAACVVLHICDGSVAWLVTSASH